MSQTWNLFALDIETGERKYSIALKGLKNNIVYANCWPVVGPDGTIYPLRPDNTLYALKDDGTKLTELWSVEIDDEIYTPPAVSPDNSVYYTSQTTLFRADGKTGKPEAKKKDRLQKARRGLNRPSGNQKKSREGKPAPWVP